MASEALWPFALATYARPGAEELFLELQDEHGQCVPYLLWTLWLAANGRPAPPALLRDGADIARAWQDAAVAPLRTMRRRLKAPLPDGLARPGARLRRRVQALELDAERMLLQMLEAATPDAIAGSARSAEIALSEAVSAWGGGAPPTSLLAALSHALG